MGIEENGGGGGGGDGEEGLIPLIYLNIIKQALTPHLVLDKCFNNFFVDFNFGDESCIKYSLSKGLGLAIILGSVMVKVPQIFKIFRARSAAGITFISVVMELFAITSTMAYSRVSGFPFSAWGEACFLAIQTSIVAILVLWYGYGSAALGLSFLVGYGAAVYALLSGLTPVETLWSMQAANIPIIVVSKLIQAGTNFRNKSTGQLSAITIFMLLFGSIARIFTSIQETGDRIVIITYIAASTVNAIIALQMLWYWNTPTKKQVRATGQKGAKGGKGAKGSSNGTPTPKKNPPRKVKKDN